MCYTHFGYLLLTLFCDADIVYLLLTLVFDTDIVQLLLTLLFDNDIGHFLAAMAALYRTMSVRPSVGPSVRHQRVSNLVILLQDKCTMYRIHTMHRLQCI